MTWSAAVPLTVTRAGDTATRFNASGYLETISANQPRFDHNPATKARLGLLVEGARTNIHLKARDIANWTNKENVSAVQNQAGIDGGASSATVVIENSASGEHRIYHDAISSNQGAVHAFSIYAKAGVGTRRLLLLIAASGDANGIIRANFNLQTGVITTSNGSNGVLLGAYTELGPDGFVRCVLVGTPKTGGTTGNLICQACLALDNNSTNSNRTGDGSSSLILDGAQLEVGDCATSLIVTTGASVSRAVDNIGMVVAVEDGTYTVPVNGPEFSFYVEAMPRNVVQNADRAAATLHDTTSIHFVKGLRSPGADGSNLYYDAVRATGFDVYDDASPVAAAIRTTAKHMQRVKDGDFKGAINGTLNSGSTSTLGMPFILNLQIGAAYSANDPFNGWIRRVQFWAKGFSDTILQSKTA